MVTPPSLLTTRLYQVSVDNDEYETRVLPSTAIADPVPYMWKGNPACLRISWVSAGKDDQLIHIEIAKSSLPTGNNCKFGLKPKLSLKAKEPAPNLYVLVSSDTPYEFAPALGFPKVSG